MPLVPQEVSVGTLDGNGKGKPIFWMSGDAANLIIKGGKICNSSKIAIYCDSSDSKVQIEGGYICGNSVNEIGGGAAISAEKPTIININGGYIYNNTSHGNGGAITAKIGSTIHITGGCIFENTASFDSPASDGETTYGFGGAIYSEGANVTVSGGYIFSNSARTNSKGGGGAIYAQGGSVVLNGGYLFDNSAKGGYGGAVYMKDGALTVSDSAVLAGNRSVKEGGIEGTGVLEAGGGAVALFGSTGVTISGGYITGNESEKTGGGLYCRESSAVTMDSGYVTNKLVFDTPGAEGVQFADFELYDLTTSPMGDKQFAFEVYQFPASYTAVTETAISGPGEVNGNNEGYKNLFDGNTGTKWYYKGAASPASIIFRTDRAVKALRYSLTTANDHTSYADRIPKAWTLYGGDSENGTWTVIAQHTEDDNCIENAGNKQEVTFDIPNPASYQYYKLVFESSVSTEIQFSEFKLYTGEANTQEPILVSTGHNDAAGNITFSNRLSFDHAGTYFFGVVEKRMEGSITSDRHWYKVAVTVGTRTENITGSNSNRITKNTYYIKSTKVEQFMNTEGHAGMVTEQGLQSIWGKEWDVDGLEYINHPYHLFLSDNEDETGEAGDSSNKSVAFVNVQKEKTVNVVNVMVEKQWASYMDANEYNTYCVTVQLFRKNIENEAAGWEPVGEENVLNRAGAWKHTWYELDKNYIYSVKEKEVYYFDGSGNRKVVSPQSFTTEYSTDGETWQETSDGAAFRPNDSAEPGIIQIRNTKKYYPMPETGGVGSDPFTVGGLAMVVLAAVMFLMHLRRQKKQA